MIQIKLREFRVKANLTQQQLADKTGVSKSHISEIENFRKEPSIKLLIHLSVILEICPCRMLECNCTHS